MLNLNTFHMPNNFKKKKLTFLLVGVCVMLSLFPGDIGTITRESLTDAYIGVAVFVYLTLFIFYGTEKFFEIDLISFIKTKKYAQVPIATTLGALPGCGGAILVISAYNTGSISFGALVAALISTMGDAAFLLLSKKPDTALVLLPICFAVGVLTGYLVDYVSNKFTKNELDKSNNTPFQEVPLIGQIRKRDKFHFACFLPGICLGVINLTQMDLPAYIDSLTTIISLTGIYLNVYIWAHSPNNHFANTKDNCYTRATEETSFVVVWVIFAFLIFEYTVYFLNFDLKNLFISAGYLTPLIAILIGFIPGCGPQIIVTTLYINGLIPFSALLGNSISNDGDALFPAIAMNPKAAINATIISASPAIIISMILFKNGW